MTLKPENAEDRGYIWVADVIYDPEAPKIAMQVFFEKYDEGYLYGEPANLNTLTNNFVGMYKPLNN